MLRSAINYWVGGGRAMSANDAVSTLFAVELSPICEVWE